ncbi:tRNA uridine-5-carboxymethylaminomethyl(34) synthesis GTPase MnmE [Desulfofustis glycolicus]|uniref:tRNA modification GTPase MnmE n=1 Tax=Desulfofustis glycolicus DSM 9705 TaxID=1121409 RepID=A0A1M5UZP8_9BACT|nr:tRNA uridine-5-carboxymethylaminomethyl(34) synthesis GTPase MnmE [Desulfofustis glycolicus]MCB2215971.1 tRNA uridine-5-carboxymethylaminomethyl(34) synthesis GTPase MnmE [Desulfobulbaceae bacterium]SHH68475.1 tRNA modification GTPase trmE [Desulfofustis glycolicus DSM 9705]
MPQPANDRTTIAAISTPPGAGGIGIIRISGPQALTMMQQVFRPADRHCSYTSHRLYYGKIVEPSSERFLDEVLAVYMAAPRTYTREDVVEIHAHGGHLVLQSILELLLAGGAHLAQPGEFTKRAFLNGRIDLTRAEAVIDILSARTRKGVDLALEQMSGTLYRCVDAMRTSLVRLRALLEVAIDFPEEDVEIIDRPALLEQLEDDVLQPLHSLITSSTQGRLLREGALVVIVGLPNVGKSSLLNTLLQQERALVTPVPGTTRDTIEEYVDIGGLPIKLVDTAGIRDDAGEIERLGIERARNSINRSDLVLFVIDGSRELTVEDRNLFQAVCHKPLLTVINKSDLPQRLDRDSETTICDNGLTISALNHDGLAALKQQIFERITGGREQWQEEGCAPNLRQDIALQQAQRSLLLVRQGLEDGVSNDLIAIDLLDGLNHLGEIVGETTTEDMLDVIFNQFCLGK